MKMGGLIMLGLWLLLVGLSSSQGNLQGSETRQAIESEDYVDVQEERKDLLLRV